MNPLERKSKIASYGYAYQNLTEALANYPKEMWQYKPSQKEWSIHEIIIHIADSEANSFVRCRRFLAEPGSKVMGYDQDKWASKLDYHSQDTNDSLELFKYLRLASYKLIKDLPGEIWSNTVDHSENGIMTLDDWLNVYEAHIPIHIKQMERVYNQWLQSKELQTSL